MSEEVARAVAATITRIESASKNQVEVDTIWHKIEDLFLKEMDKLPPLSKSNNKGLNRSYRKSQPFWNDDLAGFWFSACQAEKKYSLFKVKTAGDRQIKNHLLQLYREAQKNFDRKFRYYKRQESRKDLDELEHLVESGGKSDEIWKKLSKLNTSPNKRVLEIVREDDSISRDVKEVLTRWHKDISKGGSKK